MTDTQAGAPSSWADDRLDVLLPTIWRALQAGCDDRRSAFRNVVVATADTSGHPHARIVVLRAVDEATGTLEFHTDARSDKVVELTRSDMVELLFWDPASAIQIRVVGRASLHGQGSAEAGQALGSIPNAGRAKYRVDPAPGTVIASPGALGTADEAAVAARFTLVRVRAHSLDCLRLVDGGQRRAVFDLNGGPVPAAWISP